MSSANTVRQILPPGAEDLSLFALTALLLWRYATLFFPLLLGALSMVMLTYGGMTRAATECRT